RRPTLGTVNGVKRGKLHPEQGQIGGRNPSVRKHRRGGGALPSPRVGRMSRRATDGHRWMAIPGVDLGRRRDRTRLTGRLAGAPSRTATAVGHRHASVAAPSSLGGLLVHRNAWYPVALLVIASLVGACGGAV